MYFFKLNSKKNLYFAVQKLLPVNVDAKYAFCILPDNPSLWPDNPSLWVYGSHFIKSSIFSFLSHLIADATQITPKLHNELENFVQFYNIPCLSDDKCSV